MNITERNLMIGDWVLHDGEPYQIRQLGIYGESRDGEDYPAVCVGKPKGIGLIVERNEIESISLTTGILEKNFPTIEDGVTWSDTADSDLFNIRAEYDKYVEGIFKYVHELQHALRLAGIEKEIELW